MTTTDQPKQDSWIPFEPSVPESWECVEFLNIFDSVSVNHKKIKAKAYLPIGAIPVTDQGQTLIGGYTNDANSAIDPDEGLILFGDHTRVFKLIKHPFAPGADGIKVLKPMIDPTYSYYACLALRLPNKGYSRHYSFLKRCKFPIPPTYEQRRIVIRVEELFSDLDDTEANLKRVQILTKQYRQSLLKAAVTGELTREWRERQDPLEDGQALLQRILTARREAWELAKLEKMSAKGEPEGRYVEGEV